MWDDLRVSATMTAIDSSLTTREPKFAKMLCNRDRGPSYSGLMGYLFDHGRDGKGLFQSAHFAAQLPHGYQEGSPIEPHVHVRLVPGENALPGQLLLLEFEYCWTNIGEKTAEDTTIIAINHTVREEEMEGGNIMISFGMIEKSDAGISSMLSCRFSRITIAPGWESGHWEKAGVQNDTFQGGMFFLEFDFHYLRDSDGSREMLTK